MRRGACCNIAPIAALAVLLAVILVTGAAAEKLEIGQKVPGFELPGVDGKTYRLSGLLRNSKAVVVIWISKNCPVSRAYEKRMAELEQAFGEKRVAFVGINSNNTETFDEVKEHAKQAGFTFPVLKDNGNKVADQWHAQVTPEAFLIAPDGTLRYHGAVDDSQDPGQVKRQYLRNAVNAILSGKRPDPAETKAFGCTVKRD